MPDYGRLGGELVEVAGTAEDSRGRLGGELTQVAGTSEDSRGRLGGGLAQVAGTSEDARGRLGSTFSQVAYAWDAVSASLPNITGNTNELITFESSASTGSIVYRAWSWLSVPGGSSIGNSSTPFPDNNANSTFDMTNNEVLYHCEETSGGTGTDSSGNGKDCTFTNITFTTGVVGNGAWEFAQSNSVAEIDSPTSLTGSYTVAYWFYNLAANTSWRTGLRGSNSHHPIMVEFNSDRLGVYSNDTNTFVDSGATLPAGTYTGWHHIAAVGTGSNTLFYIDGDYVGRSAFKSNDNIKAIGNLNSVFGGGQRFADRIDEFAHWSRALSSHEIRSVYYLQSGSYASYSSGSTSFSFTPDVAGSYEMTLTVRGPSPIESSISKQTAIGTAVVTAVSGFTQRIQGNSFLRFIQGLFGQGSSIQGF